MLQHISVNLEWNFFSSSWFSLIFYLRKHFMLFFFFLIQVSVPEKVFWGAPHKTSGENNHGSSSQFSWSTTLQCCLCTHAKRSGKQYCSWLLVRQTIAQGCFSPRKVNAMGPGADLYSEESQSRSLLQTAGFFRVWILLQLWINS